MPRSQHCGLLICLIFSSINVVNARPHDSKSPKMLANARPSENKAPKVFKTKTPKKINKVPSKNFQMPVPFPSSMPSSSLEPSDSLIPTEKPSFSSYPTSSHPSMNPSEQPSTTPSSEPSIYPSTMPSITMHPSFIPSPQPSIQPSSTPYPTVTSSSQPSMYPTIEPSLKPSSGPSMSPSMMPSISTKPTLKPSFKSSSEPSMSLSTMPSISMKPSLVISSQPSLNPTMESSSTPSIYPSMTPSRSILPSPIPTVRPSSQLSANFSNSQSMIEPTKSPEKSIDRTDVNLSAFSLTFLFDKLFGRRLADALIMDEDKIISILKKLFRKACASFQGHTVLLESVSLSEASIVFVGIKTSVSYEINGIISIPTSEVSWIFPKEEFTKDIIQGANVDAMFRNVSSPPYYSVTLQDKSNNTDVMVQTNNTDVMETTSVPNVNSISSDERLSSRNLPLVAAVSCVAAICIIAAISVLFAKRGEIFGELFHISPTKTSLRSRSLISDFATGNSSSKNLSFSKLDDVSSMDQSIATSSSSPRKKRPVTSVNFDKATRGDVSLYGECESLDNMSALDDVRLNSVLQIEGSITDEGSSVERQRKFAQIWDNNRSKMSTSFFRTEDDTQSQKNSLPSVIRAFSDNSDSFNVNSYGAVATHNASSENGRSEDESFDDSILNFKSEQKTFDNYSVATSFDNRSINTYTEKLDDNPTSSDDGKSEGGIYSCVKASVVVPTNNGTLGITPPAII